MSRNTIAIIQARMGSTRLPGKVLTDLCGRPMLWHIVKRLRQCRRLDGLAIATSTNSSDEKIVEFARQNRVKITRGSEDDVLARYIEAAETWRAEYVVRVNGDAPLIEPSDVDRLVKTARVHKADFVTFYPFDILIAGNPGFEVVSLKALKKVSNAPDLTAYHKEHVTTYLRSYPEFVKTTYVRTKKVFQKIDYKLTVDYPDDFKFINRIYKRFWDGKNLVDLKKVVRFLEKNPELKRKKNK